MNATCKRIVGYGLTLALTGGLVYAGFVHETDPDVLTMLGSVEVQLRLASGMPADDKDGRPVPARQQLIAHARDYLDRIDRNEPGLVQSVEYRAFLAFLETRYLDAAGLYEKTRAMAGCPAGLRDQSIINEARMLRMAGHSERAEALLQHHLGTFQGDHVEFAERELALVQGAPKSSDAAAAPDAGSGR